MKKHIVVLAAVALGAFSTTAQEAESSALSVSPSVAYESEYIFRGKSCAEAVITPAVDFAYGDFYFGTWFAIPVENATQYVNEMDVYAGYSTAINSIFSIDVGLCHYAYDDFIDDFDSKDNSLEFYAGASADVILSPSLYIYRDVDLLTYTVEASIGHSIALMEDKVSLDLGLSLGHVETEYDGELDYTYVCPTVDISYALTDYSTISFGVRYSAATEDFVGDYNTVNPDSDCLWFGTSLSASF